MVNPTWLIEAGVYREEADLLLVEIRRQGSSGAIIPHRDLRAGSSPIVDGRTLTDHACVIGYGTFPFARQMQLHQRWTPGAWCDGAALDCSIYFAHFGKYLLNQNYVILPGIEAIRQKDWLFQAFGKGRQVFIRPTGCHKLFVGRCVDEKSFAAALAPARYDLTTQVVVAPSRTIGREWRLVVVGDQVIAASRYAETGSRSIEKGCPDVVLTFVENMLRDVSWRPDPIFMVDVCEAEGQLWLVELNGFSCSWLYQCALGVVVEQATELALRQWSSARRQFESVVSSESVS